MAIFPKKISQLIERLKKLPGVGSKTAERFVFELLSWKEKDLELFGMGILSLKDNIWNCQECGCLYDKEQSCQFCSDKRNPHLLCIIASPKEVFSIEQTHIYNGLYHVLGHLISPLEGKDPESLNLNHLAERIKKLQTKEIIIALDSTLEGDATALFLHEYLRNQNIKITRLAFGLPIGFNFDYVDQGTLALALSGRKIL